MLSAICVTDLKQCFEVVYTLTSNHKITQNKSWCIWFRLAIISITHTEEEDERRKGSIEIGFLAFDEIDWHSFAKLKITTAADRIASHRKVVALQMPRYMNKK